jgi:hypothetical protein
MKVNITTALVLMCISTLQATGGGVQIPSPRRTPSLA